MLRALFTAMVAAALLMPGVPAFGLSGSVLLAFTETYTAPDGSSCTHHGIDLGLAAGASVEAPEGGEVRFAGRIPGPHGGSILAVTVETPDGTLTLLPLEEVRVTEGQRVDAGVMVGRVAAQGDPSSTSEHLHIGLKRGGVYVDPAPLLAEGAAQSEPAPEPEPAQAPVPAPRPETRPAPITAQVPTPQVSSPAMSSAAQSTPQPGGVAVRGTSTIEELAPGVTLADAPAPATAARPVGSVAPVRAGSTVPRAAAGALSGQAPAPATFTMGALAPAFGVFAAVLFCSALLTTRRALARRVAARSPMSDRLGILLQHLKAGDTLRGLTSCPGPLPSQSRGH